MGGGTLTLICSNELIWALIKRGTDYPLCSDLFQPGDHGGAAAVLRLNSSMETRMTDGLAEVLSRWALLTSGM